VIDLKILIKFFASHREFAGVSLEMLYERYPDLKQLDEETIISVNKRYAEEGDLLSAGDEIALFPPVGGG
jgi:molybdopterin converting factor small subunit